MKLAIFCLVAVVAISESSAAPVAGGDSPARHGAQQQATASRRPFDPLTAITSVFPGSVTLRQNRQMLEFCPDNTCHGFIAPRGVPTGVLKDFAYLYIYFFSEYIYLPEWRKSVVAEDTAKRVLEKADYRGCKNENSREAARCVLIDLSTKKRLRLVFVRYDEGRRNVVSEDIATELKQ